MTDDDRDAADIGTLVALEESLWRAATRFDRVWMERVLHPDFHEFGRSGRRWSRAEILDMVPVEISVPWPPQDLRVALFAPGTALLTYVVVDADGHASNRSSLWLHDGAGARTGWCLRFHQGGPAAP